MQTKGITREQQTVNRINSKQDFTVGAKNRYIVGIKSLHTSDNPSQKYKDLYTDVHAFFKVEKENSTLGGWNDSGLYYVDLGTSLNDLDASLALAKEHKQIAIYDTLTDTTITV